MNIQGPSWRYLEIEVADGAQTETGLHAALAVLFLSLRDVGVLWWRKYVRRSNHV